MKEKMKNLMFPISFANKSYSPVELKLHVVHRK